MRKRILSLVLMAATLWFAHPVGRTVNVCIETGPFFGPWDCHVSASNLFSGTLSFTNLHVGVSNPITPPVLLSAPVFSLGIMKRLVTFTCPENTNYWETNTLRYVMDDLYFTPSFPSSLTVTGLYTYTAKVDARPVSLLSWWPAENNAADIFSGHDGVPTNGVTYAAGKVGQAFSFDGVDDYVTNAVPWLTNAQDTYTIEFWAWPTAARSNTTETASGYPGIANQRYAVFPHQGGAHRAGAGVSVGNNGVTVFEHGDFYMPSLLVYNTPITNWTHIAVVYENRQPKLYLNGVLVRTGLTSSKPSYPSCWFGEAGHTNNGGTGYGYYAGLLDEVSIYFCALSVGDIQAIHAAGSAGKRWTNSPSGAAPLPSACVCTNVPVTVGNVTVQAWSIGDSDYDGRNDFQEILDQTDRFNPDSYKSVQLSYWRFNTTNWLSEGGFPPLLASNVLPSESWSGASALINAVAPVSLIYRDTEANGQPNINLKRGTIRFWIMPSWTSEIAGGSGPGQEAPLIELGTSSSPPTSGRWTLSVSSNGNQIILSTQTNGASTVNFAAPVSLVSNHWYQLVMTYTPSNSAFYLNGQWITNGSGIGYYLTAAERSAGFSVGSERSSGSFQSRSTFDELETYNYAWTAQEVTNGYAAAGPYRYTPRFVAGDRQPSGVFAFTLQGGQLGADWSIETTTNLADWTALATLRITNGGSRFLDQTASNYSYRYYRATRGCERSANLYGFISRNYPTNYSMIAVQLLTTNNSVSSLFGNPPIGAHLLTYYGGATSVTNWYGANGWSNPQMTLNPGEGAFFFNPTTNSLPYTFVGDVREGTLINPVPLGWSVRSSMRPLPGLIQSDLTYPAANGDAIYRWVPFIQNFAIQNYFGGWSAEPMINVGESFYIWRHSSATNWVQTLFLTPDWDTDGDGIADCWETQHYGNLAQGPGADTDGDGLNLAAEYRFGTNPTVADGGDTDYDGISDVEEWLTGTDPHSASSRILKRLGYWKFDSTNWLGEAGQLPSFTNHLIPMLSLSNRAVGVFTNTSYGGVLRYRDVETNGAANINLREGTIRFWFRPSWTSTNAGGSGPPSEPFVLEMGSYGNTNGWWAMYIYQYGGGNQWTLGSSTNALSEGKYQYCPLLTTNQLIASNWYQFTITYSTTNRITYLNGVPVSTNAGTLYYPNASSRANGFSFGNAHGGWRAMNSALDELETFNYALTSSQIGSEFNNSILGDWDGDGAVNWQDAQPHATNAGLLKVTIETPQNGHVIY